MGLRARLYIPIAALLALMLFMLAYAQNARAEKRHLRVTPSAHRRGAQDNRGREHWNAYMRGGSICAAAQKARRKDTNDTKSMGNPSGMEDSLPA